jgi:hypothetical protein
VEVLVISLAIPVAHKGSTKQVTPAEEVIMLWQQRPETGHVRADCLNALRHPHPNADLVASNP